MRNAKNPIEAIKQIVLYELVDGLLVPGLIPWVAGRDKVPSCNAYGHSPSIQAHQNNPVCRIRSCSQDLHSLFHETGLNQAIGSGNDKCFRRSAGFGKAWMLRSVENCVIIRCNQYSSGNHIVNAISM